jgi:peroxiredoxin
VTPRAETANVPLQFQLDEITAHTRALVQPERLQRTEQMVADLHATGLAEAILPVGALAPEFTLTSGTGKRVRSADLLALGPVILNFFRGRWDPYDMTELEAWEALQPAVRQRKALLVGISPQTERQNAFTADRHHLTFPLLSDLGCAVAQGFRLAYTVPEDSQRHLRSMLVNVPFMNGDNSWRLPLPATYILGPAGQVVFAQAFADHRTRPEPEAVLSALNSLSHRD